MKKTLILFLLCMAGLRSAKSFQLDTQQANLEKGIDSLLYKYTKDKGPGLTVGIIKEGRLIFQKGYGMANLKLNHPNSPAIRYNIASGSKQFTALVIGTLVQQRKLSLQDSITKYIPEFPDYGKLIRIENLLYHTSGIRDYMVLMWLTGKDFEGSFGNADALNIILKQRRLNFNPGDRCVYSNSNYLLLAEIIQRVTGNSLAQYSKHLFKGLNMRHTSFGRIKDRDTEATGYYQEGDHYEPFKDNFKAVGDGGLITTLEDLVVWDKGFYDKASPLQFILQKGKLNNGNELSYGMGIRFGFYREEAIQTHPGAFLGFRSETLRFPLHQISIVCLANSENINPESITKKIADLYVFGNIKDGAVKTASMDETNFISFKKDTAKQYVGLYQVNSKMIIHIRNENGFLSGQVTNQPKQFLLPDSLPVFRVATSQDKVIFSDLLDDKYQHLTVIQGQGQTIASRLPVVREENYPSYTGSYFSEEQEVTYQIYNRGRTLYFKVGTNEEVGIEVVMPYNRTYFDYRNLETAVIDFDMDDKGSTRGFKLTSARIGELHFIKR